MTIWIVEDVDEDFRKALEMVHKVMNPRGVSAKVYRDKEISWSSDLILAEPGDSQARIKKAKHPPDIVILDFFDSRDDFQASEYYERLRAWEIEDGHPAAWVVLWSVWCGLDRVREFITETPVRDCRVVFTANKLPELLRDSLENCLGSWTEAQYR